MVQIEHGKGHPSVGKEDQTGQAKVVDIGVVEKGVVGILELVDAGLCARQGVVDVQVGQLVVKSRKAVCPSQGFQHLELVKAFLLGMFHLQDVLRRSSTAAVSLDQCDDTVEMAVGGRGPFTLMRFDGNWGRVFSEVNDFGDFARNNLARHRRLMVVWVRWLLVLWLLLGGLHRPLEFVEGGRIQLAGEGTVGAGHGLLPDSLPDCVVGIDCDYLKNIISKENVTRWEAFTR